MRLPSRARVLLVKPSALGDVVHTLPVAVAIKARRPDVEVDWLINRSFAPLLATHPAVDRAIPFERGRWGGRDAFALVRGMRARRYDVALDFQGLLRSALFSVLSGARRRVGFAGGREGSSAAYHVRQPQPDHLVHAVHRNLGLLAPLGLAPGRDEPVRFDLAADPAALAVARERLAPAGGRARVAVFPLGRWASKIWPAAACARLLDALEASGEALGVLGGSRAEASYAAEVARLATRPYLDQVGRTDLPGLVALVAACDAVVAHDSAALHLASALGVPAVALFGPSNPRYSGPFGVPNRVVRLGLDCSPCMRRTCPLGTTACLVDLAAETVHRAVREVLAPRRS